MFEFKFDCPSSLNSVQFASLIQINTKPMKMVSRAGPKALQDGSPPLYKDILDVCTVLQLIGTLSTQVC
jgi:hypothetical protein